MINLRKYRYYTAYPTIYSGYVGSKPLLNEKFGSPLSLLAAMKMEKYALRESNWMIRGYGFLGLFSYRIMLAELHEAGYLCPIVTQDSISPIYHFQGEYVRSDPSQKPVRPPIALQSPVFTELM